MPKGYSVADVPPCYAAANAIAARSPSGTLVVTMGTGTRGVVFAPISWGDASDWKRQARGLAAAGYRVASLSWGKERGQSIRDAVETLLASGVLDVVVVGACAGGTAALNQAPLIVPRIQGLVAVSPLLSVAGVSVGAAFAEYAGPVLLIGTDRDPLTPASALQDIDQMRSVRSKLIVLKGEQHGADIFNDPALGATAQRALDEFLATC
ncbi:MAG: dienelactone hydrolase family protein [Polyangiaceae bacterium]